MKIILNGIIKENPIFVLTLGLCSSLAMTNTFEQALTMGISVLIVLMLSNFITSILRKIVTETIKLPVYIMVISTLVTVLSILFSKYIPLLYDSFGIYLSLITVNCIVLGRAISYASKNNPLNSILDGFGIGMGYTISLIIIGTLREVIGSNSITIIDNLSVLTGSKLIYTNILPKTIFPMNIFKTSAGAFITIAVIIALFNFVRRKYESD